MNFIRKILVAALVTGYIVLSQSVLSAIPAAHVYHNHMPNFWPFYAVNPADQYNATPVGGPIRYTYDAQVIELKKNPPAGYTYYLPSSLGGGIMPHDDLVTYYSPDAKTGAYFWWPQQVAQELSDFSGKQGQIHVTMSGALVNNVQSLNTLQNVPGYNNPNWGQNWRDKYNSLLTRNSYKGLDLIHFTGHHSMGPLVGPDYFLKDLIFHDATLAQPYFLGDSFKSSKGFFPTELGFSERLIPTLSKLGVQWSVMGNNHFSHTLKDYPFDQYYPNGDTLVSPPNRADLRNTSTVGQWVSQPMAHEQQTIRNKYPFASTPHWVRYVDPATGTAYQLAGIPVDQAGSWLEGWEGATPVDDLVPFTAQGPRQFFVVAHDGDNSQGRAGSLDTWQHGYNVTCTGNGYCLGIDEYLKAFPIPADDVQHVQDGSWVDTRDSSSDPQWDHWHLPFGIWKGQFADFNRVTGMNLAPKQNLDGQVEGMTVSFEYGFHYLERNFALLQAALNYAKTAEQIWLDSHPNYWQPTTALDREVTYSGNQLNPWMLSFPVKGDPANDYRGGANPAELAWYFLLPAMDSGFGYYDENKDDDVKPTLAFNNSLFFSKPYVQAHSADDRTGPSVWWPQRWPYNPGSVNADKSQGWTVQHYDNVFAVYTYAYDVSGIKDIVVKIRKHASKTNDNNDDTYKVYDPAALAGKPGLNITPGNVGPWQSYPMTRRDLRPVMNGVAWNKAVMDTMQVLPAQEIGDLFFAYIKDYRDELLDYYIEATDAKGNVTRSEIQQVYVGAGRYNKVGNKYVEDVNGAINGSYAFLVVDNEPPSVPDGLASPTQTDRSVSLTWNPSTDNVGVTGYEIDRDGNKVGTSTTASFTDTNLTPLTTYNYTVKAFDAANNLSAASTSLAVTTLKPDTEPPAVPTDLKATNIPPCSVSLTWTAATDNYGVAGYEIDRSGVKVGTSSTASYTDSNLKPDTTYHYTVKAFDAAGNYSADSTAVDITTLHCPVATIYYYRPDWTTVNIHYSPTGGTWTAVPGVAMDNACTNYKVKTINLGAATGLQAVFNNGSGSWDNNKGQNYQLGTGIAVVKDGQITTGTNPCDTEPPTPPTNLAAGAVACYAVALTWTAATDNVGVAGYRVFRGDGVKIGDTGKTSYSDTTVAASTSYTYTVKAYDAANNESTASNPVNVTIPKCVDTQPPSVPVGLTASNVTDTQATISWQASTDNVGVVGYQVFRNGVQAGTTPTTSYTDSGLSAGMTYNYTVKAYDAANNVSEASSPLSVKTPPVGTATIYYKQGFAPDVCMHYRPQGGNWTPVPGVKMQAAEMAGYTKLTVNLGQATQVEVAFNNCAGQWDSNNAQNYFFPVGTFNYDATRTPKILGGVPQPVTTVNVTFSVNATPVGSQTVYVVGDIPDLGGWNTGNAKPLIPSTSPTWTTTLPLPANRAVQYKYIMKDNKGNVSWEVGGNRSFTTPASGSVTRNDNWQR